MSFPAPSTPFVTLPEENSCSEELLLPDFSIRRVLPAFQATPVELRPRQAGQFALTCGLGRGGAFWW